MEYIYTTNLYLDYLLQATNTKLFICKVYQVIVYILDTKYGKAALLK